VSAEEKVVRLSLPAQRSDDTDMANGRRIAGQHGKDIRWTPHAGWFVWDGKRWAEDLGDVRIQSIAKATMEGIFSEIAFATGSERDELFRHAKRSQSRRSIENAIALARSEPGVFAQLQDFDSDPWLLNVGNGTIDLRIGSLQSHNRSNLISKLVSVDYDASASCDQWDAFLWRITGRNDELYEYLQRFVGYLLTGVTSEQVLHFLYGLGANGKSVFCEVLAAILGEYAVIAAPDMVMARKHGGIPNDVARLRGARSALMNETSQGSRFDEAKLKDLTGSDSLTARFLHREFFDFQPTHKLVIRGNHKPAILGTDAGIWRRLRLVPFTVSIPADEQDRQLLDKLRRELPGILHWAVQGCLQWQRVGLAPPTSITEAVEAYRTESDTLGRFIEECCQVRQLAQVKSSAIYQRYREFAEQVGERAMPSKDFPAEVIRRGFSWKRTKAGGLFEGIELTSGTTEDWRNDR
jgi:putative DNA primase/helicase